MRKNRFDTITELMKQRVDSIYGEIKNQYGGSNPAGQEPISKKEMMLNYDDMMRREPQLRQDWGDEAVDKYKNNMSKFIGGK